MQYVIVTLVVAALAGVPLLWWFRSRASHSPQAVLQRAVQFASDNYDRLVSPKLEVITEPRLRMALKSATPEESVLLQCLIKSLPTVGHSIDTWEETVIAPGGMMPMGHVVRGHIYGISRRDLQRAGARRQRP